MNIIERLESYMIEEEDHPDLIYLKQAHIGGVINRALSDLYKTKPKNPITFLANWLLSQSRCNLIKEKIEIERKTKNELTEIYRIKREQEEKDQKEKEEFEKNQLNQKIEFLEKIKNSKDIENDLNLYCQELKKFTGASGVYISILDKKRKEVTDDDDETAHLSDQLVIRYVNFCDDHNFLKYKFLENEQGVTYDLFKPKEENPEQDIPVENPQVIEGEEGNENNNIPKIEKEYIPNHLIIEEVIREPKMKFFSEPKLGCYLAVDLTYKSSLSTISLNSSIEALNEFNTKMADYEQRKREFYERVAEENFQKQPEEYIDGQLVEQNQDQIFPSENIIIGEFEKIEKKYILSLDTIGQDRIFSDEERKFIFEVQRSIKENWELLEKNLLFKDRDRKLEIDIKENPYKEGFYQEKFDHEEEKFIKEYFIENIIHDEKEKEIETQLQKAKFILHNLMDDPILNELFLDISRNEVKIIKIIFIFIFILILILIFYIYILLYFLLSLLNLKNSFNIYFTLLDIKI
jgi:hypothetical protein